MAICADAVVVEACACKGRRRDSRDSSRDGVGALSKRKVRGGGMPSHQAERWDRHDIQRRWPSDKNWRVEPEWKCESPCCFDGCIQDYCNDKHESAGANGGRRVCRTASEWRPGVACRSDELPAAVAVLRTTSTFHDDWPLQTSTPH